MLNRTRSGRLGRLLVVVGSILLLTWPLALVILYSQTSGAPEFPGQESATWVAALDMAIWPWLYVGPLLILAGLAVWAIGRRAGD